MRWSGYSPDEVLPVSVAGGYSSLDRLWLDVCVCCTSSSLCMCRVCAGASSPCAAVDDENSAWDTWNTLRTLCEHNSSIGVALGETQPLGLAEHTYTQRAEGAGSAMAGPRRNMEKALCGWTIVSSPLIVTWVYASLPPTALTRLHLVCFCAQRSRRTFRRVMCCCGGWASRSRRSSCPRPSSSPTRRDTPSSPGCA